jgi:hypothetical protein
VRANAEPSAPSSPVCVSWSIVSSSPTPTAAAEPKIT